MILLKRLLPIFFPLLIIASIGDQLDEFQRCLKACNQETCHQNLLQNENNNEFLELQFDEMPLPIGLKMFGWNCESNCDYQCQDIINLLRKQANQELYQFHGKWFFERYFNIQEPASCFFSILNLISHYLGLKLLNKEVSKLKKLNLINNLKSVNSLIFLFENYKIMCKITIGAWIFSTIFHLRDTDLTEKLDYFFAGATVLSGLFVAIIRLFKLFEKNHLKKLNFLKIMIILIYVCHVIKLLIEWNYTYNMQINVLWASFQYGIWTWFSINSYFKYSNYLNKINYYKKQKIELLQKKNISELFIIYLKYKPNFENSKCLIPIGLSIWISCGLIFELFDFPPILDIFDAHSLWHLTTVVPGYIWYHWMIWDGEKIKDQIL